MSTIPTTQAAWRVVRRGSPASALELKDDIPVILDLAPGEVLVNIKAAALNPVGYKLMEMMPNVVAKRPLTAEYDFSGVIVSQKDSPFKVGDKVYGYMPAGSGSSSRGQGALASYIAVPAHHVSHKPASMKFTEAAGLSLVGLTATEGLLEHGQLKEGQHVLINGGSSAVGLMAVQIAKAHGCIVTCTASTKNISLLKALGADEVLDYTKSPPHVALCDKPPTPAFDIVFDTVGKTNELFLSSEPYLSPQGVFVSISPGAGFSLATAPSQILGLARTFLQPAWLGGVKRQYKFFLTEGTGKWRPAFAKLIEEEQVQPFVDSVFAFKDALKAYERIKTGHAVGKVVVEI